MDGMEDGDCNTSGLSILVEWLNNYKKKVEEY